MAVLASWSRRIMALTALSCTCLFVGCATLTGPGMGSLLNAERPAQQPAETQTLAASANTAMITMEIRPEKSRKPEIKQLALQDTVFLQQALERAGLVKRFRGMQIEVIRVAGDQRQKMESKYNHAQNQVDPAYDYALRAGDYVIISEQSPSTAADMMKALSGPLGAATGVGKTTKRSR